MINDIRRPLKRFVPRLLEARDAGLNEADTVSRICRFFEDVLGYDGLQDISREAQMKHKYIDICVKIDGQIRLLVEVRAAGEKLRDRHVEPAQSYAAQNNYRWILLTNGIDWHLYHLTFNQEIEKECVFSVSLDNEEKFEEAAQLLALLHKQSLRRDGLEKYWKKAAALEPDSIGKVLFSEKVLGVIRREIRRATGLLIDSKELAKSLREMLSVEAREQIGPIRIYRRRRRTPKASEEPGDTLPPPEESCSTSQSVEQAHGAVPPALMPQHTKPTPDPTVAGSSSQNIAEEPSGPWQQP
ncbi:MAG: type I restriction enzyme HsdR N-terminal domain-containing protein [Candidatus Sumerlaeia bacterium]|nr:type I restriction enzyme HsdR N-terminal domain-containing protein [Candidatus Sumerlaeia bacterium]